MDQTSQEDSSNRQDFFDVTKAVSQTALTGNLFTRIKKYIFPPLIALAVTSVGYLASRALQKDRYIVVEKPIKLSALEDKTYVTINDAHFMVDERVGKNLNDLEREIKEKLGSAYEVKKREVDDKYNKMTEGVVDEAKKAWRLKVKEPINEPKKTDETNYHKNIEKLNSMYDVILNCGKKKK